VRDGVIHAEDSTSYMVTQGEFEDFDFQCYVRTSPNANGGIFYRWKQLKGGDRGNEVQIENVPDSPHPTGSLYNVVRAVQPRYRDEEWFLMQIFVRGSHIVIRVNGETTVDYDQLTIVRPGHIALQMHHHDKWIEWKDLKVIKIK
ncbi:MAG: 3-keto-disaccharide hydrolase, partial [Candidatus Hinthialibacter sp.]